MCLSINFNKIVFLFYDFSFEINFIEIQKYFTYVLTLYSNFCIFIVI